MMCGNAAQRTTYLRPLGRRRLLAVTGRTTKGPTGGYPVGPSILERPTGFEPATSSLGSWHSATELRPPGAPILHRLLRRYLPSLSDMLYACSTSSLRAFQLSRLATP